MEAECTGKHCLQACTPAYLYPLNLLIYTVHTICPEVAQPLKTEPSQTINHEKVCTDMPLCQPDEGLLLTGVSFSQVTSFSHLHKKLISTSNTEGKKRKKNTSSGKCYLSCNTQKLWPIGDQYCNSNLKPNLAMCKYCVWYWF